MARDVSAARDHGCDRLRDVVRRAVLGDVGHCAGAECGPYDDPRAMTPALNELGLVAALRAEANSFARHAEIRCEIDVPDAELNLSDEEATTAFRIAQEALTNVARHAHASRVLLRLNMHGDQVQLCVEDDGKGIAAARDNFGLLCMRERAALLNGSLDIQSRLEGGTLVRLQLSRAGGYADTHQASPISTRSRTPDDSRC